jgi:Ca2+/H+ antiporter
MNQLPCFLQVNTSVQFAIVTALTFLLVLTVNYVVQDGKSNWLEGLVLMGTTMANTFSNKDRSFSNN